MTIPTCDHFSSLESVAEGAISIFIGQKAHSNWTSDVVQIDERGFVLSHSDLGPLTNWNAERDHFSLGTSVPGIFVASDVSHAIGRVAGATGAGSTAIRFVYQHLASL